MHRDHEAAFTHERLEVGRGLRRRGDVVCRPGMIAGIPSGDVAGAMFARRCVPRDAEGHRDLVRRRRLRERDASTFRVSDRSCSLRSRPCLPTDDTYEHARYGLVARRTAMASTGPPADAMRVGVQRPVWRESRDATTISVGWADIRRYAR